MSTFLDKIKSNRNVNVKFLGVLFGTIAILALTKYFHDSSYVQHVFQTIDELGIWAPFIYVLLYVLMSGIFMPSIVFKVFAGTIFGVFMGIIWVSLASSISSLIKFLLARYFLQDKIHQKIQKNEGMRRLDALIERDGWKMLLLLRNVPVANSMFLNYICGVTQMKVRDFVVASFIGRLPTTFLYVYLGYLVGYSSGIDGTNDTRVTFEWILLWIGLLASVALTYYVIYISKKLVQEESSVEESFQN